MNYYIDLLLNYEKYIVCDINRFIGRLHFYFRNGKYQDKRNDIINVKDKVIEFETGNVLIGSVSRLYMSNKCLLIADHKSVDKQIHIFNKMILVILPALEISGRGLKK